MAYHFEAQTHIQVETLITDLYSVSVTLYHLDNYLVESKFRIFRAIRVEGQKGFTTHEEILATERYETLDEAENAYHVLCLKAFTRISQIDKNADQSKGDPL